MGSEQQKLYKDEALLEEGLIRPAPDGHEGVCPSLLTIVGFAFLTFNATMAVYQSNRDLGAISFVGFSFLDLLVLLYCLRPGLSRWEHLKMAVWLLTTMLTLSLFMLLDFWFSNYQPSIP